VSNPAARRLRVVAFALLASVAGGCTLNFEGLQRHEPPHDVNLVLDTGVDARPGTDSSRGDADAGDGCSGDACLTCMPGFHDCGGTCVSNTSVNTCGSSCVPCPHESNAVATCDGTTCGQTCFADFGDCNAMPGDGCETDLAVPAHCGACGTACSGGTPLCAGASGMRACVSGCTSPAVRCGTSCADVATDARHCGMCNNACPAVPNGTATCAARTCGFACNMGYHACAGGCASNTSVATCGAACAPCVPPANATATCDGTACGFACDAGYMASGSACVVVPDAGGAD
jgi:hypothetical protein